MDIGSLAHEHRPDALRERNVEPPPARIVRRAAMGDYSARLARLVRSISAGKPLATGPSSLNFSRAWSKRAWLKDAVAA